MNINPMMLLFGGLAVGFLVGAVVGTVWERRDARQACLKCDEIIEARKAGYQAGLKVQLGRQGLTPR